MDKFDRKVLRGRIWTGTDASTTFIQDGVIEIRSGTIFDVREALGSDDPMQMDEDGRPYTFLPGMVDLHNHGGVGHSFPTSGVEGCLRASNHHRSRGTTTMLASLVSADRADLIAQAAVLAEVADAGFIHGIHLEGPFLSSAYCGAQDPDTLRTGDPSLLLEITKAARGHLRSMTLAPETQNYAELIRLCVEHNIVVSLGHSGASDAVATRALDTAIEAGGTLTATHLFNGMPPLHHRNPGIAGALLRAAITGRLTAELVADGTHLDDAMVELALACAPQHIALVSDAMAAAGMGDGAYTLGSVAVKVREGVARLVSSDAADGSIAGGTSSLLDQVLRHAHPHLLPQNSQLTLEQISVAATVVRAVSATPARVLGLVDRGELRPGLRADLVKLDSRGEVRSVLAAGHQQL